MPRGVGYPGELKRFKVGTNSFGVTADEAADMLVRAEEVKTNKQLMKAVKVALKDRRKAIDQVAK